MHFLYGVGFLRRFDLARLILQFSRGWHDCSSRRGRAKQADKTLPVLDVLEFRETVSDTFFAGLSAAGAGIFNSIAVSDRFSGLFGATSLVDISVARESNRMAIPALERSGWQGAVPPEAVASKFSNRSLESGPENGAANPPRFHDDSSLARSAPPATLDLADSLAPVLSPSTRNDSTISDSVLSPRPHGQIRKLHLAPPAATVGARNTFIADTSSSPPGTSLDIETGLAEGQFTSSIPVHRQPFIPPSQATPNPQNATSPIQSTASALPENDAGDQPRASSASQSGGGPDIVPPAKNCSPAGPPGQTVSGPHPSALRTPPSGPPCMPPGQQNSSVPDPLYVLNWHDGLVMAPGVIEFDQAGDSVELRAQVYGATVQSYSWNTSQASRLGCATGTSTYKLQFRWTGGSPIETTEQVTITATMTDQSTQQQTLTFKLAPGIGAQCPGSGGASFPTTTWPAVLTPDRVKGVGSGESGVEEAVVASDSATRPYAVSQASGVLYVGHGLPGYNPVGQASSLSGVPLALTYSSIAAERRPIFVGRYELDPAAAVPNTVSARLQFNGSWGSSKYYDTSPSTTKYNPGDIIQISLQADAGSLATGRYDYTFETTANYSGSSTTTSSSGSVTIINEESSVFGEGWTLGLVGDSSSSLQSQASSLFNRLHVVTGGVILNQGAGNSLWFAENGGAYATPAGDFSTLVKNGDESYTRTLKDGTKQNFNSSGYQTSLVDLNSNRLTFTYDGSNNLSTITDPNNLVTTFSYSGSCGASGKVCTITDPTGRITTLAYNASGTLKTVTDPDAAVHTFTYDSSSGRMTTLVDPRSITTTFAYDFGGRVDTATRPDSTTEQFTALQLQSLCDSGQCTSGQPGTPLISAEAVADTTDPRSNAWDTRLDWFGLGTSTQLTDPLGQTTPAGHMLVLHRNSNGSVTQSTDRLDRNIGYTLDSKANVTKVTFPGVTQQSTTTYATQQFEYNANSQLTKSTDERGNVTTWTYDAEGNLTQITEPDPDGPGGPLTSPVTTFAYTADGFVESITDARNNLTVFTRDTRDRVTQEKFPDGDGDPNNNPTVSYVYDTASNVTSRTNERGYATAFTYDSMGRTLSETDPLNHATSFQFDAAGNLARVTNALNQSTNYGYNNMNRLVTVTDALNNVTNVTYDNEGNVTQVRDPINRTTTAGYNALSYQTSTTTPLNLTTSYTRDAEAQTTGVTDPLTNTETTTYNNRGWTTSTTSPLNNTVTMGYDSSGNMASQNHPYGGQSFQHDGLDQLTGFTNEIGANTDYGYDPEGNLTSVKDPLNHTNTLAYDPRNRLVTATNALSNSTQFLYDATSNLTRITDPLNRAVNRAFDAADRLTSITLPDTDGGGPLGNPVVGFGYDNADRLTSLADPVGNTTSWTIDAAGRTTGETNPLGSRAYVYNGAGELTRVTDRNGRVREFVYDSDGRRTQELWCGVGVPPASPCSNPLRTISYGYDADGRLTSASDPDSQYTFTYDADDRVSTISYSGTANMPAVTLSNTYDGNNNRTGVSDNLSPAGSMSFSYDTAEQMTAASLAISGSAVAQVSFSYDTANRLTLISRRSTGMDKTDTSNTYDDTDRLTGITHEFIPSMGGSTTLATYSYASNAASELTTETNQDGTFTYTYDATSQLTGVDATGGTCGATGCDETFAYDLNGNRTLSTGYGPSQTYTTGTANRLLSDGTYNYAYDAEGNLILKSRISNGDRSEYTWDYRNRLTSVVLKNSGGTILQQSDYTYDAFDRRIIKTVDLDGPGPQPATSTATIYDGAAFAANSYIDFVDPDGPSGPQPYALDTRRLFGPAVDMILARRDFSGTVAWYLADHLGTVRDLVSTSGTVLDHIRYSGFGKVTAESGASNGDRFKYTAREYDSETAQYYYRARVYDPAAGRFVLADPVSFGAGDANLFRYVNNVPIGRTDRLGLAQDQAPTTVTEPPLVGPAPVPPKPNQTQTGQEYQQALLDYYRQIMQYLLFYGNGCASGQVPAPYGNFAPLPGTNAPFPTNWSCLSTAIEYTLTEYDAIGMFNVSIGWTSINAPWCPGITISTSSFYNPDPMVPVLDLIHEAIHDWYIVHCQQMAQIVPIQGYPNSFTSSAWQQYMAFLQTQTMPNYGGNLMTYIISQAGPPPLPPPLPPSTNPVPVKPAGCFLAGTLVHTRDGLRPIETLLPEDTVVTYDSQLKRVVQTKVLALEVHQGDFEVLRLAIGSDEFLEVTTQHPFYTRGGWVWSDSLTMHDDLLALDENFVQVAPSTPVRQESITVFNMRTEHGTYLVGRTGILVSGRSKINGPPGPVGKFSSRIEHVS